MVAIYRDVAMVSGAISILQCAGFTDNREELVLTRDDVALLYVVGSTLQSAVDVATNAVDNS